MRLISVIYSFFSLFVISFICCSESKNQTLPMSHPKVLFSKNDNPNKEIDTATFGGGCFWCTEAIFKQVKGVSDVKSGYCGGHVQSPTYEQVCSKTTGHAEVIQIVFNPSIISFDELLEIFWQTHDPTTLNRQGNDVGPQYRSVVFYHNDEQKEKAEHYKEELNKNKVFDNPVVTTIEQYKNYFEAENYHQDYYKNNKESNPYCYYVIKPKLEKFQKIFPEKINKQ